jgi:ankyrin repeat protein
MEHFDVGDTNFMGLPLHTMLLAEIFEENLKQCSTSTTVELPESINLLVLYDLYVKKKWDIYLSEKKCSDRTNVNVLTENAALHEHFIHNHTVAALVAILSTKHLQKLADKTIAEKSRQFVQKIDEDVEKTGIITDAIEGRPVFQHRTLAEYFVARWLCDNILDSQQFMRDHIFERGFGAVRSMVDRILAHECSLHEAVLNSNLRHVTRLLREKQSVGERDHGGRKPLHIAVSCKDIDIIWLLLELGADVSSVDTLLGLSPVDYASRMDDWEMLSLMMEKRPDIREHVLNGANSDCMDHTASAIRAAAKYGHNNLLRYLIGKGNSVDMVLPGDNSTLLHEAARSQQTETVTVLVQLGASTDSQDVRGKSPLHVSVETGNLEVRKSIVENQKAVQRETEVKGTANLETATIKGNILNVGDIDGNTPLHLAAAAGNTSVVSYLVSAGSDLNACNIQGEYPLTLAARCGKNGIVELLLRGDNNVKCEEAKISALRAAIVAGQVATTVLLLRLGVPVNKGENEMPIHTASRMGHKEIVSLLLQYGASLKTRTRSGNTALHLASEEGHLSVVKHLVERWRDDVHSLNYEKEMPLHLAARKGREYMVKYFVEKGCNINVTSDNSSTCLHFACENGHYKTVEYLLKHGAEVNAMDSANQTPLHIAASRGQTKIVELLSQHNANFSLRDKDGITALLAASKNRHRDTVLFIVQHGGNIEDTDGKGDTIAHFAVANGNKDILKLLSNQDANLDVQNSDGDTPLLKAVREERNTIVRYLVERNCDINTQGNAGMRPLDVAVLKGNLELTRLLLERNALSGNPGMHIVAAARFGFLDLLQHFVDIGHDINVKVEDGESPLHVACKSGHVTTVQYLSEHGALLDSQDNSGNTALHVAVSNDHLEVTRVLVEKGANLAIVNASGTTALHIAAVYGHENTVHLLVKAGAALDCGDSLGRTALWGAASSGHKSIVRFLLENGSCMNIPDCDGVAPIHIAARVGHWDAVYAFVMHDLKIRLEGAES